MPTSTPLLCGAFSHVLNDSFSHTCVFVVFECGKLFEFWLNYLQQKNESLIVFNC